MAHGPREQLGPDAVETDARRHRARGLHPDHRVIAGPTLGDVVQQCGEEQHFGARPTRHVTVKACAARIVRIEESGALRHRFERVPVDGEAVVRVALGTGAHVLPLGQEPNQDADVIEGFERGDGAASGREQRNERVERVGLPFHRRQLLEPRQRRPFERDAQLCRVRGRSQHDTGVDRGVGIERDPAVPEEDAVTERARGTAETARPGLGRTEACPQVRRDPHHRPRRLPQRPDEDIGIGHTHQAGDGILFLERQLVGLAAGHPVQRHPGVEQQRTGLAETLGIARLQVAPRHEHFHRGLPATRGRLPAGGGGGRRERPPHPARRLQVPEPAGSGLEVRLEHLRDRPRPLEPLPGGAREGVDQTQAATGGELLDPRAEFREQRVVAGHESKVEERGHRVEVVVGDRQRFLHRPHRLSEHEPGVPQRIPERARGVGARGATLAARVEEHRVDVRARAQLPSRVRTERDQRPRGRQIEGACRDHERLVDQVGERVPEVSPAELRARDQAVARLAERAAHERPALQRVGTGLAGADAPGPLDRHDPDLAVADLPRARRLHQLLGDAVDIVVVDEDLDAYLGHEVDRVFGAAVHLRVSSLTAEALDVGDREALDAHLLDRILHVIELERLDDPDDQLHRAAPILAHTTEGVGAVRPGRASTPSRNVG